MSKTGYVEIASRLVTVARFCFTEIVSFYGKWDILMCQGEMKLGNSHFSLFLGASKRLFKRLRPSVGWLVSWLVGWLVVVVVVVERHSAHGGHS
jgi:hypothetical protein